MVMEISFLLAIALLILFAKIFGEIAVRLRISSLVGEIAAGILLGPILKWVAPSDFLFQFSWFGILFFLFLIGLSTKFDDVKSNIYSGSAIALIGCILAFLAGFLVGNYYLGSFQTGIVLGIALLSTSTAITIRSLVDVGEFHSKVGRMALAVDMADEVLAILALSLLIMWLSFGAVEIWKVMSLFLAVIGLIYVIITAGSKFIGRALTVFQRMRDQEILVSIPLAIVFIVAFLSEHVGVAAVTGAFLAGVAMSNSPLTEPVIAPKMKVIGYGFFIPLFFAYSAIILDITSLYTNFLLVALLLAAAVIPKIIGCGFFARFFGFNSNEQKMLGISMIPRGEYAIIISQIALTFGAVTNQLYTAVIAVVVISIIITPLLLRMHDPKFSRYSKR